MIVVVHQVDLQHIEVVVEEAMVVEEEDFNIKFFSLYKIKNYKIIIKLKLF